MTMCRLRPRPILLMATLIALVLNADYILPFVQHPQSRERIFANIEVGSSWRAAKASLKEENVSCESAPGLPDQGRPNDMPWCTFTDGWHYYSITTDNNKETVLAKRIGPLHSPRRVLRLEWPKTLSWTRPGYR
jgi:hypothetical protein